MTSERRIRALYKPAEFAALVSCSRSKIYDLVAAGALRAAYLDRGRLLRIPASELDRLAAGEEPRD